MTQNETPTGRTSQKWYQMGFTEGYREGMQDIQDVLDNGGSLEDVQAWVKNNLVPR